MDSLKITNNKYYKGSLDLLSEYRILSKENRPYILIDGILNTSSNLFINTAIGLAAHEIYDYNIGFLTNGYSQEVSDFAKAIGAKVFDIDIYANKSVSGDREFIGSK